MKHFIDEEKGVFIKKCPFSKSEFENTLRAYNLSVESDHLFRVPKPIHYDEIQEKITLQYLSGIKELQNISDKDRIIEYVKKVGKALAYIHTKGNVEVEDRIYSDEMFSYHEKFNGFLHGDFNMQNVQYENDEIVIIDWHLSPFFSTTTNYGCIFHDVYWFSNSIIYNFALDFIQRKFTFQLVDSFIDQYCMTSQVDLVDVKEYMKVVQPHMKKLNNGGALKARIRRGLVDNLHKRYWTKKR